MSQHYSNPDREDDDYALPDVETFYMSAEDFLNADDNTWMFDAMSDRAEAVASPNDDTVDSAVRDAAQQMQGWYYWYCFPGCLPDSEPTGPFKSEDEAIKDARSQNE